MTRPTPTRRTAAALAAALLLLPTLGCRDETAQAGEAPAAPPDTRASLRVRVATVEGPSPSLVAAARSTVVSEMVMGPV